MVLRNKSFLFVNVVSFLTKCLT